MVYYPCRFSPLAGKGGVLLMGSIIDIVVSVAANVVSYYVCKWLDRHGSER